MAGKHRSRSSRSKKIAMMGAATATATAMTMGVAPAPEAQAAVSIDIPPGPNPLLSLELPVGVYTTGLPFRILDLIGQSITPDDLPIDVDLIEFLSALDPQAFYNAVNSTPYGVNISLDNPLAGMVPLAVRVTLNSLLPGLGNLVNGPTIPLAVDVGARAIVIAAFGFATYTTMDTYRKLAESTRTGLPPGDGYTGVDQAPRGEILTVPILGTNVAQLPALPNITVLALLLIRDPGRPNGGVGARFAPLFDLFGIDTVTPDVEPVLPADWDPTNPVKLLTNGQAFYQGGPICEAALCVGTGLQGGAILLPIHVNVGAEYDPISDFPATANPFSLVNSLYAGFFPTYILREPDLDGLAGQLADVAVGDILGALLPGADEEDVKDALNIYLTLGSGALPMLEPQRLAVDVINLFTGLGLGTPISDSLEPALKILVNIGHTDVVTPTDIANAPPGTYPADFVPYTRTLDDDSMDTPTPFLTDPLTLDEYLQVPQDVIEALIGGFTDTFGNGYQISDPLRRNALATLLNALGVQVPSLNLGAGLTGLQSSVPDTFSTAEVSDSGDTTALRSAEATPSEGSNSDNGRLADNLDDDSLADDSGPGATVSDDSDGSGEGIHGTTPVKPRQTLSSTIRGITHNVFRPFGHRGTTVQDQDADHGNVITDHDANADENDANITNDRENESESNTAPARSADAGTNAG